LNSLNVRSCAKLSYTDAQKAIDGHILGDLVVAPEHSTLAIIHDIKVLNGLAKQLRATRIQDGAVSLSSKRLKFTLDESGRPVDCEQTENTDANNIVEEVCVQFALELY
jgi:protein SSD1